MKIKQYLILVLLLSISIPSHSGILEILGLKNNQDDRQTRIYKRKISSQKKLLKKMGYRDSKENITADISELINTGEVCTNNTIRTGFLGTSKRSIFNYDQAISSNLKSINQLPPNCRQNLLDEYQKFKGVMDQSRPSVCLGGECPWIEEKVQLYIDNIEDISENLRDFKLAENSSDQEDLDCGVKLQIELIPESSNLKSLITVPEQASACGSLAVGETRVTDSMLHTIEQKFAVTNIGNNTHRVDIVIDFVPAEGLENEPGVAAKMMEKMQGCMGELNKVTKDSLGRKLNFNVITPAQAESNLAPNNPVTIPIRVRPDGDRHSSRSYSVKAKCSIMTHEMLHLLGLHDEYHDVTIADYTNKKTKEVIPHYILNEVENRWEVNSKKLIEVAKNKDNYEGELANKCRTTPTKDTIMNFDHVGFYYGVVPRKTLCQCPKSPGQRRNVCLRLMAADAQVRAKYLQLDNAIPLTTPDYPRYCKSTSGTFTTTKLNSLSEIKRFKAISNFNISGNSASFKRAWIKNDLQGKFEVTEFSNRCNCPDGDLVCRELLSNLQKLSNDSSAVVGKSCPSPSDFLDEGKDFGQIDAREQAVFSNNPNLGIPLLEVAHVEKILFPTCSSKGSKFIACAAESQSPAGSVCSKKPSYCQTNEWLTSR